MKRLAVVHVTERCNQRCSFCLEGEPNRGGVRDPSLDEVQRTLAALRAQGADGIIFMSGETLLRPDAVEIVRRARGLGFRRVMVATNGTPLARPGYLLELVAAGLDRVELSIAGDTPELACSISGVESTHARQVAALTAIDEAGLPVTVNLVVCRQNQRHLSAVLRLLRAHVRRAPLDVKLKFVSLQGRAARSDTEAVRYAELDLEEVAREAARLALPVRYYGFPLCRLGEQMLDCLELEDLCAEQQYFDRHQVSETYCDSGYQLSRRLWPGTPCQGCALLAVCPGIEAEYLELFGPGELWASEVDPVAVARVALTRIGEEPSRAPAVLEAARRLPRPAQRPGFENRRRRLRFEREGEAQAIELELEVPSDDAEAYARSPRFALAYATDRGPSPLALPGAEHLLRAAVEAMHAADAEGQELERARESISAVSAAGWRAVK